MNIVDKLLEYMETKNQKNLLSKIEMSDYELNVVVVNILSWLKLEHKRSIWISQGKKNCHKALEVNMQYPWCVNLCKIVEKEKLFHDYFSIKDGKFDFSNEVSDEDKKIAREKVYQNYNPKRHT